MGKKKIADVAAMKGWKFLNPYGATEKYTITGDQNGETVYPLPGPTEKWGPWFNHPSPSKPDGDACGSGRFHIMKKFNEAIDEVRRDEVKELKESEQEKVLTHL